MNLKIEEALSEYEERNFENALAILEDADVSGVELKLVLVVKYDCLMKLNRYDESLHIINSLIEKEPYESAFWISKLKCHYFSNDEKNAKKALAELERLTDRSDVDDLVCLAQCCQLVDDDGKALKYCNMALKIDENSLDAIREKALIASSLKDNKMMNDCADKFVELCGDDALFLVLPLMLRMFSGNYRGCLELINSSGCFDDDHIEMIKVGLYNRMIEDLNVQIGLSSPLEMTIDEGLKLMFKYHYDGISHGRYRGVMYCIVEDE